MEKPPTLNCKELEKLLLALPREEALQLLWILVGKLYGTDDHAALSKVGEAPIHYEFKGEKRLMEAQVLLLIEKLTHLSPERQAEVGDFIEFLCHREHAHMFLKDYTQASEVAFAKAWENEDDALYDKL